MTINQEFLATSKWIRMKAKNRDYKLSFRCDFLRMVIVFLIITLGTNISHIGFRIFSPISMYFVGHFPDLEHGVILPNHTIQITQRRHISINFNNYILRILRVWNVPYTRYWEFLLYISKWYTVYFNYRI